MQNNTTNQITNLTKSNSSWKKKLIKCAQVTICVIESGFFFKSTILSLPLVYATFRILTITYPKTDSDPNKDLSIIWCNGFKTNYNSLLINIKHYNGISKWTADSSPSIIAEKSSQIIHAIFQSSIFLLKTCLIPLLNITTLKRVFTTKLAVLTYLTTRYIYHEVIYHINQRSVEPL